MSLVNRSVRPAVEFLRHLHRGQKITIIHDDDPDGICSAVLLSKSCRKLTSTKPGIHSTEYGQSLTHGLLNALREETPASIIFTDVPAIPRDMLAEACKIAGVLVLDHHYPEPYREVAYANPRLLEPSAYLPSSFLAFHASRRVGLPSDFCWIAGIGVLADHGVKNCRSLFRLLKSRFPDLIGGVRMADAALMDTSPLGKLTMMITSANIANPRDGARTAFKALEAASSYRDILEGDSREARELRSWHHIVQKEFKRIIKDAQSNVERVAPRIVLYRFESPLRVKSMVANRLPRLFKKEIVLVIQKDGTYTHISLRRGDRNHVDLRSLVQRAIEAIPDANGGGHPEASAARLPTSQVDKFLKQIRELSLREMAN